MLYKRPEAEAGFTKEDLYSLEDIWWRIQHFKPAGIFTENKSAEATIGYNGDAVAINTGNDLNGFVVIYKPARIGKAGSYGYSWDKPRKFKVSCYPMENTNQIIHIVSGNQSTRANIGNLVRHIGFKIGDGTLYATVADGTTESTLNLGDVPTQPTLLEAVFTPGVDCHFYVDGVDKGAITTNLPAGIGDTDRLFLASIQNTVAERKSLTIYLISVLQSTA